MPTRMLKAFTELTPDERAVYLTLRENVGDSTGWYKSQENCLEAVQYFLSITQPLDATSSSYSATKILWIRKQQKLVR